MSVLFPPGISETLWAEIRSGSIAAVIRRLLPTGAIRHESKTGRSLCAPSAVWEVPPECFPAQEPEHDKLLAKSTSLGGIFGSAQLGPYRVFNIGRQMRRRPNGGLGTIGSADLAQNGFDMNFDGRFSHIKLAGNDLVGRAVG